MVIEIEVKGRVPSFFGNWNEMRKAKHYEFGEGLYAQVEDECVVGLVDVHDVKTNTEGEYFDSLRTFEFTPSECIKIAANESRNDVIAVMQKCCDKICNAIENCSVSVDAMHEEMTAEFSSLSEGCAKIEKTIDEGSGNGVSEKTLLKALEIVTESNKE